MNRNRPGAIIIEGHVQGLSNTRSLGEAGVPVYVIDVSNCIAAVSRFCKKFFICPDFQSRDFIEFLINLAEKEGLTGWVLIPSNDHIVLNVSNNKQFLEKYYKVITPGYDIIKNIYDKSALLKIAENQKVPYPVTQYFLTENDHLNPDLMFPLLTKGKNGLSFYKTFRKKVFLSNNESELRAILKFISSKYNVEDTFTQELIPSGKENKTVSFTAFCIDGDIKTHWMGVKRREHPVQFGTATFAESVFVKECLDQSKSLLKALNYTGVCEVEYLKDPRTREYKLIEINARTWLWVGLAKECGVDYAKMVYDYVNNFEIKWPENYNIGVCWINMVTDIIISFSSIIRFKLGVLEYVNSFRGSKTINALTYKNDNKPFFLYLMLLFSFLRKR